jgi:TRAP-type C4-dicarboxylate transport system substrate-binding protein
MVNVNLDAWNKLSPQVQGQVLEIAAAMEDEMWNLAGDMDRSSLKTLEENGMQVLDVDKNFRAELDKVGAELRKAWFKKAGADAAAVLKQYNQITGR